MKKSRSIITIAILILFVILISVFSGPLNCYFISFTGFTKIGENIFVQPDMSDIDKISLLKKIEISKQRVKDLFGSLDTKYTIIAGTDSNKLKKFGVPKSKKSGIIYRSPLGTFIIIAVDGLNEDVIAHELVHAELGNQVGWYRILKAPIWFDDGLATQVDYRPQYSEEVWKEKTADGKNIPDLKSLETRKQFYVDDLEMRRLHYTIAKHEIKRWLDKVGMDGLNSIINALKNGKDFYKLYGELEEK